jgi:5-methylcytosine-specific restriction endonuclease McrA
MRRYLEARDGRRCVRCGDEIDRRETASIGHVIARALGGSDAPANLRLEHLRCNQSAGVDRDRARTIELGDLVAVFSRARISPTEPKFSPNGARNGAIKRTSVLTRREPRRC